MNARILAGGASLLALTVSVAAWGGEIAGSRLAVRAFPAASRDARGLAAPAPLLAQRVITREWGQSEDTSYVVIEVPGYRSEGWAMVLSGMVPGAGHLYVGEGGALWFALAEVSGWTSRWAFRRRADELHVDSRNYAGTPDDPASNWSFTRFALATNGDTLALQNLYRGDRDAFYHLVGFDERYKLGWKSDAFVIRDMYQILEKKYQRSLKRTRYATGAIILTHVVAALDALHAAREHNVPLQQNLKLRLEGSIGAEGEAMTLALEKSF